LHGSQLRVLVATMFKFTGVTQEAQSLAPANADQWDEYYGSLDETFAPPKVATVAKVTVASVPHYEVSHDGKYQPSLLAFFKKRPVATPARTLELVSPQKRRKTGWTFKPEQLEKAVAAGQRLQVLPGHAYVDETGIEYYIAGDQGTVEEVDIDESGDNKFYVVWDRTGERTWHLSVKKFSIIGEAEYFVGKIVQRRDSERDWGTGRVTSLKPFMVTALDGPEARGYEWDEVRPIPEGGVEEHAEEHATDVELSPEKVKVAKKDQFMQQAIARVRKDACIAYLRAAAV